MLGRLNVAQNFRCHTTLSERIGRLITGLPVLARLYQAYQLAINGADQKFMAPKAAPQSPEMDDLETKRDGLFKLIVHTVSDKLKYSIDENVKRAAKIIMPILETFTKIDQHEREDETQDIIKLVERLLAHTAELTTLAILDEVNQLRVTNEEFQTLYEERIDYDYSGVETGSATKHRAKMNKAFTTFCAAVYGQQLVEEDEDKIEKLDEIVTSINAVLRQFNIILNRHLGHLGQTDDAYPLDPDDDSDAEDDFLPDSGDSDDE
jgi:hypothetical protein